MPVPEEREVIGEPKKYKCDYCGSVFWHVERLDQKIDCPSCGAPDPKVVAETLVEKAVIAEEREVSRVTGQSMASPINSIVSAVVAIVALAVAGDAIASVIPGVFSKLSGNHFDSLFLDGAVAVTMMVVIALFWRMIPKD